METLFRFLHNHEPSPILATIGPASIYWYGFLYLVSFVLGYALVYWQLKRWERDPERAPLSKDLQTHLPDFAFGFIIWGLIGARLYHVTNELSYYWHFPSQIIAIWNGGLAIHGALLAGALYVWWYTRKLTAGSQKSAAATFFFLADLLAPAVLLGQSIGRFGNYFNQELFGRPTNLPWGIPISPANRPELYANVTHFHPTFLYEATIHLAAFLSLLILSRYTKKPGTIFALYLLTISTSRTFTELIRIDQTPYLLNYRLPFILSCILMLVAILLLSPKHKKTI